MRPADHQENQCLSLEMNVGILRADALYTILHHPFRATVA